MNVTNMIRLKLAQIVVVLFYRKKLVKVNRIEKLGIEDVYNMTVDKNHNYCVCDGTIIKNCDALRYGCEELQKFGVKV